MIHMRVKKPPLTSKRPPKHLFAFPTCCSVLESSSQKCGSIGIIESQQQPKIPEKNVGVKSKDKGHHKATKIKAKSADMDIDGDKKATDKENNVSQVKETTMEIVEKVVGTDLLQLTLDIPENLCFCDDDGGLVIP
jgi:hypothetical protein